MTFLLALLTVTVLGGDGSKLSEVERLQSSDESVRLTCIRQLGEMGPKARGLLPVLIKHLRREAEPKLRIAILDSLVEISPDDETVHAALIQSFADADLKVWVAAVYHIRHSGPGAVRALSSALESENKDIRRGASLSLANFEGDLTDAIPALRKALFGP